MTPEEQTARVELSRYYGDLTSPIYAPNPEKAERQLQEAVRKCWAHKQHFPRWVREYVKKWSQAKNVRGDQRPVGESHDDGAVRSPDEGRGMA